jgi:DNA processing protein
LSDDERRDWLRLSQSENVGPVTFRALLQRFGSAAKAIEALPGLSRNGGLKRSLKLYPRDAAEADLERAARCKAQYVAAGERGYPPYLRHIHGSPPLLCVAGDLDLAGLDAVAIVGARNASAIGLKFTRMIAGALAEAGFLVVSGLARGIDTAAHQASLDRHTAAVVAGGIDHVYPPENASLHAAIGLRGLLISEMPPGMVPKAEHFPRRNRIISGMARATIVVEAAMRSGSLITARLAAEQGRDVFAVPGSPLDPRCEGTNKLIRDGASLLTSAQDIIEALNTRPVALSADQVFLENEDEAAPPLDVTPGERDHVLSLLSPSPVDIDDLVRESGLDARLVTAILLELELAGRALRQAGSKVSAT